MKILYAILAKAGEKGGTWFLAKKFLSLERWVVMKRDIENPILELQMEGCYQVRTAKAEDLHLFEELSKTVYVDVESFAKRLRSGQTCYIALDRGKIIYFVWVSSYGVPKNVTSHFVKLKPREVYMYHALCLPEYRRKRIHSSVMTIRLKDLQKKSFEKAYVDTQINNVPQVKTLLKHGFVPYKVALVLTLAGRTFYFALKQGNLLRKFADGRVTPYSGL